MSDFVRHPRWGVRPLTGYLNGWSAAIDAQPSLVVSYEQLHRDAQAVTADVLTFLGLTPEPS